jgi:hypothetical protein
VFISPEVVCPVLICKASPFIGLITLTPLTYKFRSVYVRESPKKLKELICEVDAKTVSTDLTLLLMLIELACKTAAFKDEVEMTCVLTKRELKIFVWRMRELVAALLRARLLAFRAFTEFTDVLCEVNKVVVKDVPNN